MNKSYSSILGIVLTFIAFYITKQKVTFSQTVDISYGTVSGVSPLDFGDFNNECADYQT